MADSLTFDVLKTAWDKLRTERKGDLQRQASELSDPEEIYVKRISEDPHYLTVEFLGFLNAVTSPESIPQAKRLVLQWLRKVALDVQIGRSDQSALIVRLSKDLRPRYTRAGQATMGEAATSQKLLPEAAISIFKRDPKTNKTKRYYKCIGGKKNGRRVANPDDCIGVPDFNKRVKFGMTKRAKYGQSKAAKKKTQLTNIVSKRTRKANQRLKKARGF